MRRNATRRRAFTLVEVLLALVLTTILVASLLSSLDLYRRLTTTEQRDVEHARIARALFELVSGDVRAVAYAPPEAEEEEEETSEEDEEAEVIEITDPTEAYSDGSIGLVGDETTLVVHTSRPARPDPSVELGLEELLVLGERTSDLRSVSYFLAVPGSGGLPGTVADVFATNTTDTNSGEPLGLVRLEGDRLTMTLIDESGDAEALAAGARLVAPEVKALRFRYFDGTQWLTAWDSVAYERLPRAVEVVIGVRIEDARPEGERSEDEPLLVEHRFVVAIPQADPTPLEEVLQ